MATDSLNELISQLKNLESQASAQFSGSSSKQTLYDCKVQYLGKNGSITDLMKKMGQLSPQEKPQFGQRLNEAKQSLEEIFRQQEERFVQVELAEKLAKEGLDLSLPSVPRPRGGDHPVFAVTQEIVSILSRLGYSVRLGPAVEKDYYNFEALNIPKDHPARDMQDTFFIDSNHVLRTHTSPIQIHSLEKDKLPLRIVGTGSVFRVDSDISHLPHFHQIEGMCVDKDVSMADLKGTISFFVREFFGADLKTRFRPSYFPFTEPSAEVDCSCPICKGNGCSLCKQSGWIEIGGAGLVNPKVFEAAKIPYPEWTGFAFGFGIERMAIIKYGIPDIRLLPQNDLRFLRQFEF